MGDPAGVGPELVLRALVNEELRSVCRLVVFGDANVLARCAGVTGLPQPVFGKIVSPEEFLKPTATLEGDIRDSDNSHGDKSDGHTSDGDYAEDVRAILVDHAGLIDLERFVPARVDPACGAASFAYIQSSIDAALAGRVAGVTTGPINKEATHAAGIRFPGHTEMFAERAATGPWCMMQYSPEVTCTFVTVHCGYAEVPGLLTEKAVLETIELTFQALQRLHGREPHIAVCGLNPHAGENGLFGNREEQLVIAPAIERARRLGISIEGPLPPDTAFLPGKRKQVDAIVCMYHDQGHIPLKALAFDSAVNTTLGLSVIRTSVDHGTAYDIAWQATAIPDSLLAALRLASRLAST